MYQAARSSTIQGTPPPEDMVYLARVRVRVRVRVKVSVSVRVRVRLRIRLWGKDSVSVTSTSKGDATEVYLESYQIHRPASVVPCVAICSRLSRPAGSGPAQGEVEG